MIDIDHHTATCEMYNRETTITSTAPAKNKDTTGSVHFASDPDDDIDSTVCHDKTPTDNVYDAIPGAEDIVLEIEKRVALVRGRHSRILAGEAAKDSPRALSNEWLEYCR